MTLFVAEYPEFAPSPVGQRQVAFVTPITTQQIAVGAASAPLSPDTRIVRLVADAACEVTAAAAFTATNALYLPANFPEYFAVSPGEVLLTQAPA